MVNYLYLPKLKEKKVLQIELIKSPLDQNEFLRKYLDYYVTDLIQPLVFLDLSEFRTFLKTIQDNRPMAHNSCIDEYHSICVHYMNGDEHCKVALYGYRIVNN